jgi:hypothetical protein
MKGPAEEEATYSVVVIACDEPHDREVYALFDLTGSEFPGAELVPTVRSHRGELLLGQRPSAPRGDGFDVKCWPELVSGAHDVRRSPSTLGGVR